jgi:hypothetical protein
VNYKTFEYSNLKIVCKEQGLAMGQEVAKMVRSEYNKMMEALNHSINEHVPPSNIGQVKKRKQRIKNVSVLRCDD